MTHSHFDYISVNGSDFAKGKPSQSPTRGVIAKTRFSGLIIVYSFLLVSFRFLFSNQVAKLKRQIWILKGHSTITSSKTVRPKYKIFFKYWMLKTSTFFGVYRLDFNPLSPHNFAYSEYWYFLNAKSENLHRLLSLHWSSYSYRSQFLFGSNCLYFVYRWLKNKSVSFPCHLLGTETSQFSLVY